MAYEGWSCRGALRKGGSAVMKAMRQRIVGLHIPPCHRRMVITTQFSVLPCCTSAVMKGGLRFPDSN